MGGNSVRALSVFAGVVVLLALGGCGGGDDGGSTAADGTGTTTSAKQGSPSGASLSEDEFVERAIAICKREKRAGLAAMGLYVKQHGGSAQGNAVLVEALRTAFLPHVQTQVEEIRALGAPNGDDGEVQAYLDATEEAVDRASAKAGGSTQIFGESFEESAQLAHDLGIDKCAYGG
ncbi:MAG TPA: hypothetical protein VHQ43_04390 [Solirubrobacterales bacterium]|jgi:hypothetical protein|nr:hypothetical protein [Solirubrobacterales bacterium]